MAHKWADCLHNPYQVGPLVIFFPMMKRWGPPKRQGLCSQSAHLWATSDFVPHYEEMGTRTARVK